MIDYLGQCVENTEYAYPGEEPAGPLPRVRDARHHPRQEEYRG